MNVCETYMTNHLYFLITQDKFKVSSRYQLLIVVEVIMKEKTGGFVTMNHGEVRDSAEGNLSELGCRAHGSPSAG